MERRVPRRALRERLTDRYVISAVCEPLLSVISIAFFPTRDASPPLVLAFDVSVLCLRLVLAFSACV